jgi:DNA-binding transcriptional MerR regulator
MVAQLTGLDRDRAMFPISTVADILRVHQRTLRIYDQEGLLSPKRSLKNRRLYSQNDIERGQLIQYMTRELGINLAGVKILFTTMKCANVHPTKYLQFINDNAFIAGITPEIQAENRVKLSRRGRKARV